MQSFLNFGLAGTSPSGKTKIFTVSSVNGSRLGAVQWHSQWRKYAFFPIAGTLYDPGCLREISDFCERVSAEHKES